MRTLYAKARFEPETYYTYRYQLLKKSGPCTWKAIYRKADENDKWIRFNGQTHVFSSGQKALRVGRMKDFQILSDVEFFNEFL